MIVFMHTCVRAPVCVHAHIYVLMYVYADSSGINIKKKGPMA